MIWKHCNRIFILPLVEKLIWENSLRLFLNVWISLRYMWKHGELPFSLPGSRNPTQSHPALLCSLQCPFHGELLINHLQGVQESQRSQRCPKAAAPTAAFCDLCLLSSPHNLSGSVKEKFIIKKAAACQAGIFMSIPWKETEFQQRSAFGIKLCLSYEYIIYF